MFLQNFPFKNNKIKITGGLSDERRVSGVLASGACGFRYNKNLSVEGLALFFVG